MVIRFIVPEILKNLTLISDILLVILLLGFVAKRFLNMKKIFLWDIIWKKISKNALEWAFVVAMTATLGSLFYSEIMGFEPCKLCWFQRIFMYPMTILLAVVLYKKDKNIGNYAMPLSIIGGLIALYHYITQRISYSVSCGIDSAVPCTVKYTFAYGYITIPMMALTAFIMITVLTHKHKRNS